MSHTRCIRISRILAPFYQMLDTRSKYFSPGELDAQSKKARNRARARIDSDAEQADNCGCNFPDAFAAQKPPRTTSRTQRAQSV